MEYTFTEYWWIVSWAVTFLTGAMAATELKFSGVKFWLLAYASAMIFNSTMGELFWRYLTHNH